jgi:glutaredoxin-like YruB-family protein
MEENEMTIRLYSTSTCPWCEKVKAYLRRREVAFEECDIARDPSAVETIKTLTGQVGVPVLDIDGRVIVGFDRDAIDDALGAFVEAS